MKDWPARGPPASFRSGCIVSVNDRKVDIGAGDNGEQVRDRAMLQCSGAVVAKEDLDH
jgi:hypothetical protein